MKSVVEQRFFYEFAFGNKALKTFVEFRICWKRLKFECRRIQIRTSSHPYWWVTAGLVESNGSLLMCLWLLSPVGWETGISSKPYAQPMAMRLTLFLQF